MIPIGNFSQKREMKIKDEVILEVLNCQKLENKNKNKNKNH
jgi:hypothetical protein